MPTPKGVAVPKLLTLLFQGSTHLTEQITLRKYPLYAQVLVRNTLHVNHSDLPIPSREAQGSVRLDLEHDHHARERDTIRTQSPEHWQGQTSEPC